MNADHEFDRIARAWLADGPERLPDRVLDALAEEIHLTRQRHAPRVPRRIPIMTSPARLAAAAVLGVLLVGGAAYYLGQPEEAAQGGPGPLRSPSPAPTGAIDTSTWIAFTSDRNGISVRYPTTWTPTKATASWPVGTDLPDPPAPILDTFVSPEGVIVAVASQRLPANVAGETWLAGRQAGNAARDPSYAICWPAVSQMDRTTVDGQPAWLHSACDRNEAVVFVAGRVYDIVELPDPYYNFALFRAFLSTVAFDPATAVDSAVPSTSPLPYVMPALSSTFTSPRYGYTISIAPDWKRWPAIRTWAGPDNSPEVVDEITVTGTDTTVSGAAQQLAPGQTFDQWLVPFHDAGIGHLATLCLGGDPATWPPVTIGSATGRWQQMCNAAQAVVEVDGWVYVFSWGHETFNIHRHLSVDDFKTVLRSVQFGTPAPQPSH
jgi:hypothetical protein